MKPDRWDSQRQTLFDNLSESREQLEATFDNLSAGQPVLAQPKEWTFAEHLAHLAYWEKHVLQTYQVLLKNENPPYSSRLSDEELDEINAEILASAKMLATEELREIERVHAALLLEMVRSIPNSHLFDPAWRSWMDGQTIAEWIENNTTGHYAEHGFAQPSR